MQSRVKFVVVILYAVVAISAIFLFPSLLPRNPSTTANDQVNNRVQGSGIFEEVFQYPDVFLRNYALMEKGFKIFIYPNKLDDEAMYYNDETEGFSTEMFFYYHLNFSERFYTDDDAEAHMFFIPLTCFQIGRTRNYTNAENYVRHIINEYPHWNRSKGVDHFLLTCCDAGEKFSERVPLNNSIRVSCFTSNDSRHDIHHKHHHTTIPQMGLTFGPPVRGNDIHQRTKLAFWACHKNYPARASASDWDKYSDEEKFKASKYCICDGASYVTRICITDSIHFGCVPVILYEDYELPFSDILDWAKFSVIITKDDPLRVEQILEAMSHSKFSELHNNVLKVQRHFHANSALEGDKPYDIFHMIMYELWLRHLARSFFDF
ncbi:probable glycosyltransferase At5g03795 [Tripterygium wilfordii]|uniref:probable glycosyltransferase At5g03795 n=1 Tax=Tripterygium wilfordii TaxID=458696 RepID=UPI0018F830E1|nr:probable glycosyltransferase At5g03795 [Tripterygium wilfordii]